jgi:N-acetyl-gamma-glutamyl-phosphate reductase
MTKVGILGAAGYTGGELIRLLLFHPEAQIAFAHSESNAGNLVSDIHEGLTGDTDLRFTNELRFDQADVLFFCFGHGKSREFLSTHEIPVNVKVIDLAQDFRTDGHFVGAGGREYDFVYGLPEANAPHIAHSDHVANPGCFATCLQLALLPAARMGLLTHDVVVNAVTGSTGAGQKPQATTHFSWRAGNMSVYKAFEHQHLPEVRQTLAAAQEGQLADIDFIPWRGDFARGIFATCVVEADADEASIVEQYRQCYSTSAFTHYSDRPIDLKQVVNTNKCLVHAEKHGRKLLVTAAIDNLLKGAVGQAVQNMNLMFNLDEQSGLKLKASAF